MQIKANDIAAAGWSEELDPPRPPVALSTAAQVTQVKINETTNSMGKIIPKTLANQNNNEDIQIIQILISLQTNSVSYLDRAL